MVIGIDGSRAFLKKRTGIEEYSYQVIGHLRDAIPKGDRVMLYVRADQEVDIPLPGNWTVRKLRAAKLWTQVRLSLEMLMHPPDVLFVPAHVVPIIHPARTVVTIHGLEYEFCPGAYSFFARWYMRISIRLSCRWASRIISVSENTKRDLASRYGVPGDKVSVVYEGIPPSLRKGEPVPGDTAPGEAPYLLFIGRLEERKNVVRIIEAFELLKKDRHIPHTLVLAGKPGYGYDRIGSRLARSAFRKDISELGYVGEEEKWELLRGADIFLFPTLYEGFGLPVIEAQSVGLPVLTSNVSSLPEVGGDGAVYADPYSAGDIAGKAWRLLSDADLRDGIIRRGRVNVERFGWEVCARTVATIVAGK